eukprot:GILJ01017389.1.p1 GENE.GILJ01017389.1~~GILJ01017389.1.p1  ORF type:complete len:486 (-),score=65.65 GILJ01017389.1:191-1648(-)
MPRPSDEPTEDPQPPATTYPDPDIQNAPELDGGMVDSIFHSAVEAGSATVHYENSVLNNKCRRLEILLVRTTIISPLYIGNSVSYYHEALALSGIVLVVTLALSLVTLAVRYALFEACLKTRRLCDESNIGRAMAVVRFPGIAIQIFCFLSYGSAVAAGLSISQSVALSASIDIAPIISVALLVVTPFAWTAILAVGPPRYVKSTKLDMEFENVDDDRPLGLRTKPTNENEGRVLYCAAVRPTAMAKRFGPLIGDLRFQSKLTTTLPAVVPWILFVSSFVVGLVDTCQHLPLVAAAVALMYSAAVVGTRPFLGISHNAAEAFVSLAASGLLLGVWIAFNDSSSSSPQTFGTSETALALAVGCLLNCRYPFVLARALDVTLPQVVAVARLGFHSSSAQNTAAPFDDVNDNEHSSVLLVAGADASELAVAFAKVSPRVVSDTLSESVTSDAEGDFETDEESMTTEEVKEEVDRSNDEYTSSVDSDIL